MLSTSSLLLSALLLSLTTASSNSSAPLTKPPLRSNLNYLKGPLFSALPPTNFTSNTWLGGYLPSECASIAKHQNFSTSDITAYEVTYSDCDSPWILCRHRNAPAQMTNLTELWGRVPVRARSWVKHLILLPGKAAWAYNLNASIAIFDNGNDTLPLTRLIHEMAHSLDLQGSYMGASLPQDKHKTHLSASKEWIDAYNLDTAVPDGYAHSKMVEDVAQVSVVAAFDLNVPEGFRGAEPQWKSVKHQVGIVETKQREAGGLLIPGGRCVGRFPSSHPVLGGATGSMNDTTGALGAKGRGKMIRLKGRDMPDVSLAPGLEVFQAVGIDTRDICSKGH